MAFWGHFLVLCTAGSLELLGALSLGPPPGLCSGPTGGLIAAPTQPAAPGNEIRSLHIVLSAGYHCHPCMPSRQIWPTTLNSFKKGLQWSEGPTKACLVVTQCSFLDVWLVLSFPEMCVMNTSIGTEYMLSRLARIAGWILRDEPLFF